jgi:hypothetical protein
MRCLLTVLLLTACSESHLIGDFDSGPRVDATTFDVSSFDVSSFDVPPHRDTGARDAGAVRVDGGPVFDGGLPPPLDIRAECIQLCERADMCIEENDDDCIDGCIGIQEFVRDPVCQRLATNLFRCAESVPCEELARAFEDGACRGVVQVFGENCGDL